MNKILLIDRFKQLYAELASIKSGGQGKGKLPVVLRYSCGFLLCFMLQSNLFAQQITLKVKQGNLEQVLKEIRKQSGYNYFLNANVLQQAKPVSLQVENAPLKEVLANLFKGQPLTYKLEGNSIIIQANAAAGNTATRARRSGEQNFLDGRVTNSSTGAIIVGASIKTLPSGTMSYTDGNGVFTIPVTDQDQKIQVTFLGMQMTEVNIQGKAFVEVQMNPSSVGLEDVVVTGLYAQNKSTFTGASRSFTGEELKAVAPTSVIEALSMLTPGLVTLEQKATGSNPNALPDILIRGVTSFSNTDQSVNQPLIVRDGTIVTLADLYDMDINEIQSITVLKDASAASLYGAKAANGVIVIERKRIAEGKLKVIYNLISSIQAPDFSDYKVLNPMQKLEYEKLAGLYSSPILEDRYALDSVYNSRYQDIRRGVYTDWLAQPSRIGSTHDHSLRLAGGSQGTRYEVNARFAQVNGVMKGDGRDRYGLGFALEHYAKHGLSFSNRTNFSYVGVVKSPYGEFSHYVQMNPYDRIRDDYGNLKQVLSWDNMNPLYEANLGSYDKNHSKIFSNDFDARWELNQHFRVTSHWNLSMNDMRRTYFQSPLSGMYRNEPDLSKRGSLAIQESKALNYSGNLVLSYNKVHGNNNLLSTNIGGTINRFDTKSFGHRGIGFYSDELDFMKFAAGYPANEKPSGSQDLSADVAGFLNMNYSLNNRYYVDAVYQISGSSKFGVNNRYGHFWSSGLGWNLHNESFLKDKNIDLLKLRGSVGFTGKVSFNSYQALTTYQFGDKLIYLNGIGAVPITIGNPDLKWERTLNYNVGADVSILNRRLNLTADVYLRKTTDLLIDKTVAPSTGVTSGKDNLGEMENKGIEVTLDGYLIRNSSWSWQLGTNLVHNTNKILKISSALEKQNQINNDYESLAPMPQFQEGESTTAIKVVQSGGIDPATGQEIYIKRNGERTFSYNPADKIVVGDLMPKLSGNVFTTVRYQRLSMAAYFGLRNGGYIYNTTRASKVEGANPKLNADERVFNDRWKQPGDIALYKDIADQSAPKQTTRFVEKENTFALERLNFAYDFSPLLAKKIGASKLAVGMSINDLFRLSTVRIERGTSYLYSRGADFNINVIF